MKNWSVPLHMAFTELVSVSRQIWAAAINVTIMTILVGQFAVELCNLTCEQGL